MTGPKFIGIRRWLSIHGLLKISDFYAVGFIGRAR